MKKMILCGGLGSRMGIITKAINKHLLPVKGDKPMVDAAIQLCIRSNNDLETGILFIVNSSSIQQFAAIFTDEYYSKLKPFYACQTSPIGIADAIKCGEHHCGNDQILVILGDTLLDETALISVSNDIKSIEGRKGCYIWTIESHNAKNFGVVELDNQLNVVDIVEKPQNPPSNHAVIGIYVFDSTVWAKISKLSPSARGEFEVTDLIKQYLDDKQVHRFQLIGNWNDMGLSIIDYFTEAKL